MLSVAILSVIMPNVIKQSVSAPFKLSIEMPEQRNRHHYAECYYAECRLQECCGTSLKHEEILMGEKSDVASIGRH